MASNMVTKTIIRNRRLAAHVFQDNVYASRKLSSHIFNSANALLKKTKSPSVTAASASSFAAMSADSEGSSTYCRPCSIHDREEMISFMSRWFVTREPLMQTLGATPENSRKYVAYCIDEALDQKASFIAIDEEADKVTGLRLNVIGPSSGEELKQDFGRPVNALTKFLHYMESDMPEILKTKKYMRHVAICVEPSAAQCGIATDLMQLSVDFAKKQGLWGMTAMCSWKLPYKLASKMGYEKIREVRYDDYTNEQLSLSKDHFQAFSKLAEKESAARLMVKKIH